MKKTTKRKLTIVAFGLIVASVVAGSIWFFSGKKDVYCSVIPSDAVALARIDCDQLTSEHNIEFKEQKYLGAALILEMIKKSGVDFSKPIYAFACTDRKQGAVLPIKDVELFRDFLKNNGFISFTLSQAKGYDWAIGDQYAAVFDNEKCLILTGAGMNVRTELVELMEQDADESILDESLYENIMKCKKPIAVAVSMRDGLKKIGNIDLKQYDLDDEDIDMDLLISFDAKDEKATLALDIIGNNRASREAIDEVTELFHNLKGTYLNTIDSDPLLWFAFNGLQNLKEVSDELPLDDLKKLGIDTDKLLSSFSGEASIIVPNNSANEAIFLAEVENNDILDIFQKTETLSAGAVKFVKINENEYVCSFGGMPIFAGIKKGTFYLTNSQKLASKVGEEINSNMAAYADEVKAAPAYMCINAAQAFNASTKLVPGSRGMMMILGNKLSVIDRFYMSSNGAHTEFVICAKEGKDLIESLVK